MIAPDRCALLLVPDMLEPDLCWSCSPALPLRPSTGHSVLFVGETDKCEQLIMSFPFPEGKLIEGFSPVWGFLCWSLLAKSELIGCFKRVGVYVAEQLLKFIIIIYNERPLFLK